MSAPENCVKVTQLRIKIGNLELEITPEEARELKKVLDELIGPKAAEPIYIPMPTPNWDNQPFSPFNQPEPIWVNPNHEPWPNKWHITCGPLAQSAVLCINR